MSELKSFIVLYDGKFIRAYEESEADKVIARQKYKRCLAIAGRCFTKSNYHFVLARHGEDAKENNRRSVLYSKWQNRWLAIAEKFKPNPTINRKGGTNALQR